MSEISVINEVEALKPLSSVDSNKETDSDQTPTKKSNGWLRKNAAMVRNVSVASGASALTAAILSGGNLLAIAAGAGLGGLLTWSESIGRGNSRE